MRFAGSSLAAGEQKLNGVIVVAGSDGPARVLEPLGGNAPMVRNSEQARETDQPCTQS